MFAEAGERHRRPHFHAYFQGRSAVFAIGPIERLAGNLPVKRERLVLAWAEIHQEELSENWRALRAGRAASRIEPLR